MVGDEDERAVVEHARCSTASRISPSRASLSRTDASAISECGPPSWNAESVSVKLHHMNRGAGYDDAAVLAAPDADGLLGAHVVDDARPRVVLRRRTKRSVTWGRPSGVVGIERTDMLLPNGDRIVTTYSKQTRAPIPPSTFEFKPPTGTEVTTPLGQ